MKTVHTIGCSFTNWIYPTWSDYIAEYTNLEVVNLAKCGQGNDAIKYNLYTIDKSDHVFIMFSGYDRYSIGFDNKWLKQIINQKEKTYKIKKIIRKDLYQYFKCSSPLTGFFPSKYIDDYVFSIFHYYSNMLANIYDCQNYLELKNIDYTFSLWQGFYNDVVEIRGINQAKNSIQDFLNNKLFQTLYDSIKWNKFVQPKEKGLWEHMLTNKTLVEVQSTVDYHPSTLCHLSYFKKYIKPILESKTECRNNIDILENKALQFSKYYKQHCENLSELPEFDQGLKQEFFKKYNEY